jgi:hypothetical protein
LVFNSHVASGLVLRRLFSDTRQRGLPTALYQKCGCLENDFSLYIKNLSHFSNKNGKLGILAVSPTRLLSMLRNLVNNEAMANLTSVQDRIRSLQVK